MAQIKPRWTEIPEFVSLAAKLIDKFPERFGGIDPSWLIAYGCINKERPEAKTKPYDMSGSREPEGFTNSKRYFVKVFMSDWEGRSDANKIAIVAAALERIDKEAPDSGNVGPFDYKDQGPMVRTFGPDWYTRGDLPNLLKDNVQFVDEPKN